MNDWAKLGNRVEEGGKEVWEGEIGEGREGWEWHVGSARARARARARVCVCVCVCVCVHPHECMRAPERAC
jgi:hypothetical protein